MNKMGIIALALFALVGCGQKESSAPSAQEASSSAPASRVSNLQATALKSQAYINEGLKQLEQSNIPAAITSFDSAIKANPRDPRGYLVLGQAYLRLKRFDRAIDTFSAMIRVAPRDGEAYYLLAVSYGLSGDKALAKENAEKSIKIFQSQKDEERFMRSVALLNGLSQEK